MKFKISTRGIRFRLLMYFLVFTLILMLVIWFLHTYFLKNYYQDMKITQTEKTAMEMITLYQEGNIEAFLEKGRDISDGNDIYVQVSKGSEVVYPSTTSTFYHAEITESAKKLSALNKNTQNTAFTEILRDGTSQRQTYLFASYLDKSKETTLYLVTPLYPIKSTVRILQNQLKFIGIIAITLSLILAFYLSSRITKPIISLTQSANQLASGRYGITFPVKTPYSEISALANTLNRTSISMEKYANMQRDLMANVSHDLRTPLTMIRSYGEMIRDLSGDNPKKRNEHIKVIIEEADRLNNLVTDMMTLTAVQSKTLQLNEKSFSIQEALSSTLQPYILLEEQQGYTFQYYCRENLHVYGDEDKIKQVLSNLITNAIKYCGKDKEIHIIVRHWGKKVRVEIIDHGMGIRKEELPYIWERHFQSSTTHVRSTTGTGLGLSIVKEILSLHNAKFGAESKVGKGSTFWFELPYSH